MKKAPSNGAEGSEDRCGSASALLSVSRARH
jgi:hypothetical protein